jgi:hypothetical protein
VGHWKALWKQSQVEIHHLQGKLAALTKENKTLQANQTRGRKRKAKEELNPFRRMTRSQELLIQVDPLMATDDLKQSEVVMYHIFAVDEAFKKQPVDERCIAAHLFGAAHELDEMLGAICLYLSKDPPSLSLSHGLNDEAGDTKGLEDLRAFERAYGLILGYLASSNEAQELALVPVVHKCVVIFQQFLTWVASISKSGQIRIESRSETGKLMESQTMSKFASGRLNTILTKALLDLIGFLSPKSRLHFQIFEGITFLVLQRSGSLLYSLNFGHDRGPSLEQEIEDDQATFAVGDIRDTDAAKSASLEAKYLFKVLKKVMTLAPQFYCAQSSTVTGRTRSGSLGAKRFPPSKLPLDAKRKLQETLLTCIWNEKRGHADITECLTVPVLNGPLPALSKGYTLAKSQSWFTAELWKLIGWEILGR